MRSTYKVNLPQMKLLLFQLSYFSQTKKPLKLHMSKDEMNKLKVTY